MPFTGSDRQRGTSIAGTLRIALRHLSYRVHTGKRSGSLTVSVPARHKESLVREPELKKQPPTPPKSPVLSKELPKKRF